MCIRDLSRPNLQDRVSFWEVRTGKRRVVLLENVMDSFDWFIYAVILLSYLIPTVAGINKKRKKKMALEKKSSGTGSGTDQPPVFSPILEDSGQDSSEPVLSEQLQEFLDNCEISDAPVEEVVYGRELIPGEFKEGSKEERLLSAHSDEKEIGQAVRKEALAGENASLPAEPSFPLREAVIHQVILERKYF